MFRVPDPTGGDPRSQQPGAPRMLPFSRVGPIGLALMLGVVLMAVFLLSRVGDAPPPEPEVADAPDTFLREQRLERLDDAQLAEQYPTLVRDELQQEVHDWFQQSGRQAVSDRQDLLEEEWVRYLLSDDVRPRLERLPGWVGGELPDIAKLVDEPGPHRGKLVQVWGAVGPVEPVRLPTDPPREAWRVRIDDRDGRAWSVVTTHEPPPEATPGSWVKAFGVFVKLRPVDEGQPSLVVLSPQKLLPSYPPVEAKAISPEWAAEVDDSTLEKSQHRPGDEDAFWLLMNYVRTLGPEGYRAKVASGELKPTDMTGPRGAQALADFPAQHRFELVRLRVGLVTGLGAFVTDEDVPENRGNIRAAYRGYVGDDQQRVIWVLTPFPASAFDLKGKRLAIVEGFFYKRIAVEKKGGGLYWMPVVVATSIRPVDVTKPPSQVAKWAAWIAIGGVAACFVLWAMLAAKSRREREEVRRRHEERVSRRGANDATTGP